MAALAMLAGPAAADAPGGNIPNVTAEATGPSGAAVSFDLSGLIDDNGPPDVSCTPASGSTFPITTTGVSCTATDTTTGEQSNPTFSVTVQDTTPPTLNLPSGITVAATGPDGAAVSYSADASDIVDGTIGASCSPASGSTFAIGTTSVNCSAQDAHGNSTSGGFTVTVQPLPDTTPPTLSLPGPITVTATDPSGAVVTYSATASDAVDGPITPSCSPASGATFPVGPTTVNCSATDSSGNTATGSFPVTVNPPPDTTPPVLNLPGPITAAATGPSGAAVTYTVTATDAVDGPVTPSCAPASGSTFPLGPTQVNCSAQDAAGNKANGSFTVTVQDTTPPTLTLPGPITVAATGPSGAAVTYSASATDSIDGPVTPSCSPGSGSTFPTGTTTVSCSAKDASGNTATGSFTVTVQDTTPPTLTLPSPITVPATGATGAVVTYTVSATDSVDGAVSPSCSPGSGSTFPVGTTTVNCSAQDSAGNTANGSFAVTVQDTTPPTLTLPSPITVTAAGLSGAVVTFTASAADLVDGQLAPTCTPASGSLFHFGMTTVNCSAHDAAGNTANGTFTVMVRPEPITAAPTAGDRTPPVITVPASMKVHAAGPPGTTVDYSATAVDAAAGKVPVSCTPASGSVFAIGSTAVSCKATDANGNTASRTFSVTVVDDTPPPDVTALSAKGARGKTVLSWQNPTSVDFDHVAVVRIRLPRGAPTTLYRGDATTFTDNHALDGVKWEYIVFAVDAQGNMAGVAVSVTPHALRLVRPSDGAAVKGPPLLLWARASHANYYNVQLFRGSTKLLSVWPVGNRYQLPAHWRFGGRPRSLAPGLYHWFVWPGYGPRRAHSFGGLLGTSTFVVNG